MNKPMTSDHKAAKSTGK